MMSLRRDRNSTGGSFSLRMSSLLLLSQDVFSVASESTINALHFGCKNFSSADKKYRCKTNPCYQK